VRPSLLHSMSGLRGLSLVGRESSKADLGAVKGVRDLDVKDASDFGCLPPAYSSAGDDSF